MKNYGLLLLLMGSVWGLQAQPKLVQKSTLPAEGINRNSISNLHAEGNTLWTNGRINFTTDEGTSWFVADVDSVTQGRGSVFSLDIEGEVIWLGLGFSERQAETQDVQPVAMGFAFSEDGGSTWKYRLPPLDAPNDSTEIYGVSTLDALPVVTPVQSPPYDIDYDPIREEVWVAGWAGGIRKSANNGASWERVVLPPDNLNSIQPNLPYEFYFSPVNRGAGRIGNENHKGFSVLVDENGTVWAGTSGGLNRSLDGGISWQKFTYNGSATALLGNWITSIEEQPMEGASNPIWISCWRALDANENFGVVATFDKGTTFEQMLVGEKIYDFAFKGNTVYAVGDNGLFITKDNGRTWTSIKAFYDTSQPDRYVRPDVRAFSVAVTENALWVGTADGLLRSFDDGKTWKLFRAEVPLHPQTPSESTPDVTTYAYPNPFSPLSDNIIRIRYELYQRETVTIRIFDFGMNLVRTLVNDTRSEGVREEIWDGTDANGLRLANGPYFYVVKAGDKSYKGKILILE